MSSEIMRFANPAGPVDILMHTEKTVESKVQAIIPPPQAHKIEAVMEGGGGCVTSFSSSDCPFSSTFLLLRGRKSLF